jgi:dTDP-4-amino-4,6-dideoxygalactose transaminase
VTGRKVSGEERVWRVPLSDLVVDDDEVLRAVDDVVSSGWWSMGPQVHEFEAKFATFCGARNAVAVANGTAALHVALLATGCGPGDEVVVPSLNFVAAANAVRHAGADPVFCDILGKDDLNLDPSDVEAAISSSTRAIIVLHYGGFPCAIDRIIDIASARGLVLIEDAAHAPGASWQGQACGTIGTVGCFSFFANKNLPVGEGGMIVTDDDDLAARMRLLRSHGMTTLTWDRHRGHAHTYDVVTEGFNYRLDELRAAIGIVHLGRLRAVNDARARIADHYRRGLHDYAGITVPFGGQPPWASSAHHLAVIVLPDEVLQTPVRAQLAEAGIQTSVHYPPIHRFSAYADAASRPLPQTDAISQRLVTLPLFAHMEDQQVALVVEHVRAAVSNPAG